MKAFEATDEEIKLTLSTDYKMVNKWAKVVGTFAPTLLLIKNELYYIMYKKIEANTGKIRYFLV